jgi:hypothetical protein
MKDFIGKKLNVDDFVAFVQPSYRTIILGQVVKITNKMIKVQWPGGYRGAMKTTTRSPSDLAKVESDNYVTLALIKR